MIYRILKDGQEVNTIVADPVFVAAYCEKYGYTFEAVPVVDPEPDIPVDDSNVWDELDAAYQEGVNSL